MNIKRVTLTRYGSIPGQGTFGCLQIDGWNCVTLEREWLNNAHNISCIPQGGYICSIIDSPKHGYCYQVTGVPDRSNIEIHVANVMQEVEGCIALGKAFAAMATKATHGQVMWGVKSSRAAFDEFMHIISPEDFILSIINQ